VSFAISKAPPQANSLDKVVLCGPVFIGVPMVVFRPIPGQEERNCDFLLESGAAVRAHDLDELHYRLRHFVENPEHLAQMRKRAAEIGRPRSAFDVARSILGRLTPLPANGRVS